MSDILNKTIVLVLNRNWQAIHVRTPQKALCMVATNAATALEIEGEDYIRPKLCARAIRERDGNRCQYVGKLLKPDEGSLDQVLPRCRGGSAMVYCPCGPMVVFVIFPLTQP